MRERFWDWWAKAKAVPGRVYPAWAWGAVRRDIGYAAGITITYEAIALLANLETGGHYQLAAPAIAGGLVIGGLLIGAFRMQGLCEGHKWTMLGRTSRAGGKQFRVKCRGYSIIIGAPVEFGSCSKCGVLDVEEIPTPADVVRRRELN